jgi:hypothetical protein
MIAQPVPITIARTLAKQGFAVFPVRGKQPLTSRGVYSASRDISQFSWRDADGVGIATGEASGVDVLDVDIRLPQEGQGEFPSTSVGVRDGIATLAALPALPETRAASTPHGGRHYWFRHFAGSRNRTKLAPGLEWFSNGKLVVVPPAPGRQWICEAEIAEAPDWLKAMVQAQPHTNTVEQRNSPGLLVASAGSIPKPIYFLILRLMPNASRQHQRWARSLWKLVADKTEGRNEGLNYAAYNFRKLISVGAINASGACQLLLTACATNSYLAKDGEDAARATIMSGLGIREWPT